MSEMESLYQQRLARYVTAMRNEKPDCVPIRPFVAEFTANVAGFTCQQVTHDYNLAYEAVIQTAKAYDFDAMVANMVWVWTGLSETIGLDYYAAPGIHIAPDIGFQYLEPPEGEAFMRADEYDELILRMYVDPNLRIHMPEELQWRGMGEGPLARLGMKAMGCDMGPSFPAQQPLSEEFEKNFMEGYRRSGIAEWVDWKE